MTEIRPSITDRAHLHRVVQRAADLHVVLEELPEWASRRIGLDADLLCRLGLLASTALWASTADLHQRGEYATAQEVARLAAELDAEKEAIR